MHQAELLKTFNCGIGMMLVVAAERAEAVADLLAGMGESVVRMGSVVPGQGVVYAGHLG
jgi:phosphoribosylformylglycinamidine cyclo-ligase